MLYFIKRYRAWILLSTVSIISLSLWLMTLSGVVSSMYQVFGILGVLAWTTMWAQYVANSSAQPVVSKRFTSWTNRVVLALILAHPSIFLVQMFIDTGLLPPESYLSYVGPYQAWAIVIAIAALAAFLLYEALKHFRGKLTVRGLWPYIGLLQALAMVAIFIHGLVLGTSMSGSYFAFWWVFLGAVLAPCLVLQVARDFMAAYRLRADG